MNPLTFLLCAYKCFIRARPFWTVGIVGAKPLTEFVYIISNISYISKVVGG